MLRGPTGYYHCCCCCCRCRCRCRCYYSSRGLRRRPGNIPAKPAPRNYCGRCCYGFARLALLHFALLSCSREWSLSSVVLFVVPLFFFCFCFFSPRRGEPRAARAVRQLFFFRLPQSSLCVFRLPMLLAISRLRKISAIKHF
jgi:hypothetical protein